VNPYITLPKVPILTGRQDFIIERCRGRKVLHLGCVDTGLISERLASGEHMHQRLAVVASEIWGIDIDEEGINILKDYGFENLYVGDICYLEKIREIQGEEFDVILATEVIEHLMNPGLFLESVKTIMIPNHTELIISVPNAFRIANLLKLFFRNIEYIHPDHNYWFSYYTITNLIRKSGMEVKEVYVYSLEERDLLPEGIRFFFAKRKGNPAKPQRAEKSILTNLKELGDFIGSLPRRLLVNYLYAKSSFWGDGIIVVCKRPKP
jgi:predicted TPR repeat methyltransferase